MPSIAPDRHYHVYILSSRSRAIYIGVTSDLARRIELHRSGAIAGHTRRYRIDRLVYFEGTTDITAAIARERQLKGWRLSKKIQLIESLNPTWEDLADIRFKAITAVDRP
jgi:putative endonuclease